jgi:hypothetical protein
MNLSLPTSLSETEREEQRKIKLFAPLSVSERGWGRGQIRLVELILLHAETQRRRNINLFSSSATLRLCVNLILPISKYFLPD